MSKSFARFVMLAAPLVLSACGEGWEVQRTSSYGTYEGRTAGTGVAYVRAKLLPKKDLVVEDEFVAEPVVEEIKSQKAEKDVVAAGDVEKQILNEELTPVLEAENIFVEAQKKGFSSSFKAHKKEQVFLEEGVDEALDEEEGSSESLEHEIDDLTPLSPLLESVEDIEENEGDEHSSLQGEGGSAESYVAQVPKMMIVPKVQVIKALSYQSDKTQILKTAGIDLEEVEEGVRYTNEVVRPQKYLVIPSKRWGASSSLGEEKLSEIYKRPF